MDHFFYIAWCSRLALQTVIQDVVHRNRTPLFLDMITCGAYAFNERICLNETSIDNNLGT